MRILVNILRVVVHLAGLVLLLIAIVDPLTTGRDRPGDYTVDGADWSCSASSTGQDCTGKPTKIEKGELTLGDIAIQLAIAGLALQVLGLGMAPSLWSRPRPATPAIMPGPYGQQPYSG